MRKILLLSYCAGFPGSSPSEWLDDKVNTLSQLGHEVTLVTFFPAKKNTQPGITHYRIPSISLFDFKIELKWAKENNELNRPYIYLFFPIAYTFGFILDKIMFFLTKGIGEGRVSWTLTSFIFSTFVILPFRKIDTILSTGGPAASHLSALGLGKIFNIPVIVELQDPLVGSGIGRASSSKLLFKLEQWLTKFCKKVVYVTQQAANESKKRHNTTNAICIYPGSRKFNLPITNPRTDNKIRFLHLGTLYSSRSLISFIQAIENLIKSEKISEDQIEVINLGNIFDEHKEMYLSKKYFKQISVLPRMEALAFASQSDVNLIVQHTDPRSSTTIPYKTYDYFNLPPQILGLTNSSELSDMLNKYGYQSVDIKDVSKIAEVIYKLIKKEIIINQSYPRIEINIQVEELINLHPNTKVL